MFQTFARLKFLMNCKVEYYKLLDNILSRKKKNKKNYKGGKAMSETVSGEELKKINGYAREPLTEDKVFVFRVALCDNDIDRDGEKFSSGALEKLAELFKGRTGIFDHDPKSVKQSARIFDTWVETLPEKVTADGEVYRRLMAKAYMVRTGSNGDLISEIQGGDKEGNIHWLHHGKEALLCMRRGYAQGRL